MQPGSDVTFAAALVWLCALTVVWLRVPLRPAAWMRAHPVWSIALAATVARLVPTLTLDRGLPFDIEAHWTIGSLVLDGQNVYTAPLAAGRYPYPPLHGLISAVLVALAQGSRTLFLILDKAAPGLCGVAIAVAVWAAARRLGRTPGVALAAGLLYALNPLPALVTGYHGQFEEIPLLFIVLAVLALVRDPALLPRPTLREGLVAAASALLLGVAIAYKSWPVIFLPPLVLYTRGWTWCVLYAPLSLVPLGVSLLGFRLAFGTDSLGKVLGSIAGYNGSDGFCWGYVSVLRECWVHPSDKRPNAWVTHVNEPLLLAVLIVVCVLLLARRRPLEGLATLPFAFYLFAPGWGPNYSIWVLPGALLLAPRLANRYTLVVLPAVALTYLDSLYAAFPHDTVSWAVLKPVEAALGLVAWIGIAALLIGVYLRLRPGGALSFLVLDEDAADAPGGVPSSTAGTTRAARRSAARLAGPFGLRTAYAGMAVVAVTLLAAAVDLSGLPGFTLNLGQPITLNLGNDLGGGTRLLLQAHPLPTAGAPAVSAVDDAAMARTRRILEERIDAATGSPEPIVGTLTRRQDRFIVVQLAGTVPLTLTTVQTVACPSVVRAGAHSHAASATQPRSSDPTRGVPAPARPLCQRVFNDPTSIRLLLQETGHFTLLAVDGAKLARGTRVRPGQFPVLADNDDIVRPGISVGIGPQNLDSKPVDDITVRPAALDRIRAYAAAHGRPSFVGIAIDNIVYDTRPTAEHLFRGQVQIQRVWPASSYTNIDNLATILMYGALPVHLTFAGATQVGPSISPDTMRNGAVAALAVLAVIILAATALYRFLGLLVAVATVLDLLGAVAVVKFMGVTLTLAGLGGLALALLAAVGANTVIAARVHREVRAGQPLELAVDAGFTRAWPPIRAAAVLLMALCALLWWVGSSWLLGVPDDHSRLVDFAMVLFIGAAVAVTTTLSTGKIVLRILAGAPTRRRSVPGRPGRTPDLEPVGRS